MTEYEKTEQAYKNGYAKGFEDGKPKWIPVTERLPSESDGSVLVCFPDVFPYNQKEPFVNAKHDRRVEVGRYSEHSNLWSTGPIEPIAWMLLPDAPKEG